MKHDPTGPLPTARAGDPATDLDELEAPVLDLQAALEVLDNDRQILVEVLQTFREQAARYRAVLTPGDEGAALEELDRAAHSLKSAARLIGGTRLAAAATQLEGAVRAGGGSHTAELLERVRSEFERLLEAIEALPASLRAAS